MLRTIIDGINIKVKEKEITHNINEVLRLLSLPTSEETNIKEYLNFSKQELHVIQSEYLNKLNNEQQIIIAKIQIKIDELQQALLTKQ